MLEKFFGKRQEQWVAVMLLAVLVVILIPLFMISKYSVPTIDDFCYATTAGYSHGEVYGFWEIILMEIKNSYLEWKSWQGLYFVNFVSFVINALCMREYYYLTTVFTLGFMVVSELLMGCVVLKHGFGISKSLAVIFVIPCLILQVLLMPSPVEAFFWMCGSVIYITMLSFSFLYIGAQTYLLRKEGLTKSKERIIKALILLGSFMVGGSNYLCMMLNVGIGACIVFYTFWKKHKNARFFLLNYILFIICMLICVFSPGSANRQASSGEGLSAVEAIVRSFVESFHYIKTWTILPIWVLVFCMIPVAWKIVSVRKYRFPLPALFSLGTYCIYSMLFTPNLYALGIIGAYRSQNIYRIALYILMFINLLYWIGYARRLTEGWKAMPRITTNYMMTFGYSIGVTLVVLGLILYYSGSTVTSVSAVLSLRNGTAEAYYATYQERLKVLEDETVKDAVLESYIDAPYVLFFGDIKEDPAEWENVAMARYFKKDSVARKK